MARRPYSPRAARRASSTARVDRGEDLAAALEQHLAGGRELDAARGAVEQRLAELGLEAADLLRERRLRDVQPLGGAAEVPLLGDGDEVAQVPELHVTLAFISKTYSIDTRLVLPHRIEAAPSVPSVH